MAGVVRNKKLPHCSVPGVVSELSIKSSFFINSLIEQATAPFAELLSKIRLSLLQLTSAMLATHECH
jgi:hypothetical protein